jgi:putative heme-binding domain-containing protein
MTSVELVDVLESENGWRRDAAARLLVERRDPLSAPAVRRRFRQNRRTDLKSVLRRSAVGRLHAMYVLAGLHVLDESDVLAALADEHPRVREHAARIAPSLPTAAVTAALCQSAENDDPRVRYQTALSLGDFPATPESTVALARIALADGEDRWTRFAVLSSSSGRAATLLSAIMDSKDRRRVAEIGSFLTEAATLAGREGQIDELKTLIDRIEQLPTEDAAVAQKLTVALATGLARANNPAAKSLTAEEGKLAALVRKQVAKALADAVDAEAPLDARLAAAQTLALAPLAEARPVLAELLAPQSPGELQRAAISVLSRTKDPNAATTIIDAWEALAPAARGEAVEALLARDDRIPLFLAAVGDGRLADVYLDPARVKSLTEHRSAKIRELARSTLASRASPTREEREMAIAAYRDALSAPGDAERGRLAFRRVCAACHRLDDFGNNVGPDLAAIRNHGAEAVLLAVLDPNREVNPQYVNYTLRTTDGRTITGMIATETATSVTLRRAEAASDTILREEIDALRSSGASLMPEGLEKQLSKQQLADVIAYLLSPK